MKRTVPRLSGPARATAKGELVGLAAAVVSSTDPSLVGLEGTVVDETLRTVTIRVGGAGGRRVRVSKDACTLAFSAPTGAVQAASGEVRERPRPVVIDGRAIGFRPEDRTKKVR